MMQISAPILALSPHPCHWCSKLAALSKLDGQNSCSLICTTTREYRSRGDGQLVAALHVTFHFDILILIPFFFFKKKTAVVKQCKDLKGPYKVSSC